MPTPIVDRVYLRSDGLELFLGGLEVAIMRAVWKGARSTRDLVKHLEQDYRSEIALTTVATTANRLVAKQLLRRSRTPGSNGRFFYLPVFVDEEAFIDMCVINVIDRLLAEHPNAVTAYLDNLSGEHK